MGENMRRLLLAVGFGIALGGGAQAADVIEPVVYDWTGAYIGAQAGYAWGDTDYHYDLDPGTTSIGMKYDGFVGGVTAGYNVQLDQIVLGFEADATYADLDDDVRTDSGDFSQDAPCFVEGCTLDINWFGTARIRLGYALDTFMPFVTGGLAVADVEGTFDHEACGCSIDDTKFGWTVGGGVEWAFSERWSAKAEYLYVDLGKPGTDDDYGNTDNGEVSTSSFDFSVVRIGVNYRM